MCGNFQGAREGFRCTRPIEANINIRRLSVFTFGQIATDHVESDHILKGYFASVISCHKILINQDGT